jgi:hypothetical protein
MNEHTALPAQVHVATGIPIAGMFCILVFFAILVAGAASIWLAFRTRQTKPSQSHRGVLMVFIGSFLFVAISLCLFATIFFVRPVAPQVPAPIAESGESVGTRPADSLKPLQPPGDIPAAAIPEHSVAISVPSQSTPAEWLSADLNAFEADVYPGMAQAAGPLARKIRENLVANRLLEIDPKSEGFIEPASITVYAPRLDETDRSLIIAEFSAELRKQFAQSKISISEPGSSVADGKVYGNIIALTITAQNEQRAVAQSDLPWLGSNSGDLHCAAITNSGHAEASVGYMDKPWVEQFSTFASKYPRRYVAGYSNSLGSSESEARQEAFQDAAEKLRRYNFTDLAMLENAACDRFVQKLSRPYGDVWRVAVLYDVPTLAMEYTGARTVITEVRQSHRRLLVLLFILTIIICGVLNMVTYGYYRLQISVGWVVVVLGLLAVGGLLLA